MFSQISVIYNPNSTGSSKEKAEALVSNLKDSNYEVVPELIATEHAGHAIELGYEIAKWNERPLIISSSGDGGYNELINGALRAQAEGAKPVCAVLPAGNANDHRRTVRKRDLAESIVTENVERIDVLQATITRRSGETETRWAHSYIGVGLTPAIAVELNRNSLSRWKETWIVFKSFRDFHPVEVEVEGQPITIDSMIFANISQMAKYLVVADNADLKDGRFELVTFPYRNKVSLIISLLRSMLGGLKGTHCRHYEFTAIKDMLLQFDGEVVEVDAGATVRVEIDPQKLSTLR